MLDYIKINSEDKIIEGVSIGGVNVKVAFERLKNISKFRYTYGYNVEESLDRNLNGTLIFKNYYVSIEIDFESKEIRSIKALKGYSGGWKDVFIPGQFSLSDVITFDWRFEHMTSGLITSEKYKGIGFVIPKYINDKYNFNSDVSEVKLMLEFEDFIIDEIVVFPEFIGNENNWQLYSPYEWDENIIQKRINDRKLEL